MSGTPPDKAELRRRHVERRAGRSVPEQQRLALGLRDRLLTLPELAGVSRVAAFVSQQGEPGTGPLIEELLEAGVEVIVPVLLDDFDLDWAPFRPDALKPGRFGLLVPTTPRQGVDAVATVAVVVCPGVAVDRAGNRLGRGGGSYDRALQRCGPDVLRVQLAYDDEVVDAVPVDEHDQPVDVIVTPTTTLRTTRR